MYVQRRKCQNSEKTYECSHLARKFPKKQLHMNNMTQTHTHIPKDGPQANKRYPQMRLTR